MELEARGRPNPEAEGSTWAAGCLLLSRLPSHLITAGAPSLLQPNDDVPVKLNTAAILREGALYQRQVEKELQRWGRQLLGLPFRGGDAGTGYSGRRGG